MASHFHASHSQPKMALLSQPAPRSRVLTAEADDFALAIDSGWMMLAGALVFFMHVGFSMLEAGCVKPQNRQSILLKNISITCLAALTWFAFGYGFAFGEDSYSAEDGGGVIGTDHFFAGEDKLLEGSAHRMWFFQYTFCATAATIVSGALAERVRLSGFLIFAVWMTAFTYPVVVHWAWAGGMFAKLGSQDASSGAGYLDFAGSGVVHMFGGVNALVGAAIVGPRTGRFDAGSESKFRVANPLLVLLGTFFLWFGWFGFNAGSTLGLTGGNAVIAARCCITTTCAGAAGGLTALLLGKLQTKKYDLALMCNGILAGLVGITAGTSNVEPVMACIMGAVGAIVMWGAALALEKVKIDDPVGAFPVHGAAGAWGVIAAGLFDLDRGVFYIEGAANGAFGPNLLGVLIILVWAAITSAPVFLALKATGLLRVGKDVEADGIDRHEFVGLCDTTVTVLEEGKAGVVTVIADPLDVGFGNAS